jgi:lipid-A-disaccharide synthase
MKYFFIAGERSGDLHGGNLIRELKRQDQQAEVVAYGGNYMREAGADLLVHYSEISFMGFLEVVKHLKSIKRALSKCKQDILLHQPDVLVLVDFPGFNLRMAAFAKQHGIKTAYYISPKIWAWKESRIKKIKAFVDKMYVIFPFEVSFYQRHQYAVEFVGNPLVAHIAGDDFEVFQLDNQKKVIAFLPGSRLQEVNASINTIQRLSELREDLFFLVAGVDNLPIEVYQPLKNLENVRVEIGKTYQVLKSAQAAIVTSGTATLETALLGVPQVVCYRTSWLSYQIGKRLVKIPFISLVNLIANKPVVKELIQEAYNESNVLNELDLLLEDQHYRKSMLTDYEKIRELLTSQNASEMTANRLIEWLSGS